MLFFYQKIWLSVLCVPTIGNALELNLQHAYLVCVHVEAVTYWLTTIVLKVVNWNCNSVFLTSIWSSFWNIFYSVLYFFPQKQVIKIVNPIIYYTALSVIIIRIYVYNRERFFLSIDKHSCILCYFYPTILFISKRNLRQCLYLRSAMYRNWIRWFV